MINFIQFPPLSDANEDGLLAMGGQLTISALVSAYSQGIFPWYNAGQPILWWSPHPRLVLLPSEMKVSRSLRKVIKRNEFQLHINRDFDGVIQGCAWRGQTPQVGEPPATWISNDMTEAYKELYQAGYAHSIETWQDGQLVGGLYGLTLGSVFFGESMFSRESNASKLALWGLCEWLLYKRFNIIDCQVTNDHLLSLGAREIPREDFMEHLERINIDQPNPDFAEGSEAFFDLRRQE